MKKKNFKFYALLAVLILAAVLYFGKGSDAALQGLELAADVIAVIDSDAGSAVAGLAEAAGTGQTGEDEPRQEGPAPIDRHGSYDAPEDVALFIHTYGCLPDNYISKAEAEKAGWSGGSVEKYFPGKCIGGSRFGNYEGLLPEAQGRRYTECDVNTLGKSSRGAERIVFSNDGLIYYTDDHYDSFTLLYGKP